MILNIVSAGYIVKPAIFTCLSVFWATYTKTVQIGRKAAGFPSDNGECANRKERKVGS